jgi:hypothetical protein
MTAVQKEESLEDSFPSDSLDRNVADVNIGLKIDLFARAECKSRIYSNEALGTKPYVQCIGIRAYKLNYRRGCNEMQNTTNNVIYTSRQA